ncbi:MAG TPA: ATP-binding cassette domain-containing protein [Lachnospiraceae bacterium]|nr:ATP-binding cassette domain-containing protein [Lachnospiraceae bacterium]
MENIIEVKNLKKYFKEVKAVDDISFQVEKGELFGFLGVNGAGKTTVINMLCTLYPKTEGTMKICGYDVSKEDKEVRKRIGVVYQNNCLDEKLTVKENLMIRGSMYELDSKKLKQQISSVCQVLSLEEVLHRPYAKLSGGQKRKCEIARALVNAPEVLFLDEPTTGLDPVTRKSVWKSIELLRKELNMTVFLTTHYMEEAARSSHIAIIDSGKLVKFGTPFSLKEQYAFDKLKLVPTEKEKCLNMLNDKKIAYKVREEFVVVNLTNTLQSLPILKELEPFISGFEVVQGSMDDVFLNVTGKTLEQA